MINVKGGFIVFFLFLVSSLNSQNSQVGGFLYTWESYDSSYETGLGPKEFPLDSTAMRRIVHAPEVGIHPRVFFGPSEIPDIKLRLATTKSGQAVAAQIHAYTTLLQLGAADYDHNSSYGSDNDGNRWIDNIGFWDSKTYYDKLISEDTSVWDGVTLKRRHITSCAMALEAFECLMHQGETELDTGLSYDDRATDLAKAMAFWASLVIGDPEVNASNNNYNLFGGTHMALAYDLNYNAMTEQQQDIVRQAIAQIIPDSPRHGGDLMAFANTSNWSTLNSFEIILNLAIEGESSYKEELTEKWMRALHNFISYGWYPSGAGYEGLGKNYQFVTTLIAVAKRGYSLLAHPHVKAYGSKFLPAILQPFGHGFTSYDVWGGSGNDAELGGYKNSPSDIIGLKWIFPDDPKIDFIWRNYIEKSVAHNSEGYVYQQIRPDDSYYNYLLPAAIFASDYTEGDWENQSKEAISKDYFAADRGLTVMKSSSDKDALAMQFHARQDMGGHTHGDRNDITISGLERIWIRKTYGGSQFQPTKYHSCILIDDKGMGVGDPDGDKCRQPAKILEYLSTDEISTVTSDAAYAYSWEWHWSPQDPNTDHPWIGNDNWEPVNETWGDFLFEPLEEPYTDIPFYDYPHWHQPHRLERMIKRPYNPMEKLFRTAGMVRGENSFILIADVAKKDNEIHNYKWVAQIARDLTIEETVVNLSDENYRNDIILTEPATTGNRKLLVRVLQNTGLNTSLAPGYIDTLTYEDFFTGNSFTPNPNHVRPRLIVESNSTEADFITLIYPFRNGDALPVTNWNSSKDTLTVVLSDEETQIAIEDTNEGYVRFKIADDSISNVDRIEDHTFNVYPNPTKDYIYIETNKKLNDHIAEILDGQGRLLHQMIVEDNGINVKHLTPGIYFIRLKETDTNKRSEQLKFVKI